jgi:cysteinyl-tRNA synthetase
MDHFVDQVYKHGVFEMKVMSECEKKRSILKNWMACKKYFLEAADEIKNFNKSTAKRVGYHSVASMEEETEDATEMEENVNLVLEAMQKSAEEINAVLATNSSLEATIKEQTKQISRLLEMNNNLVKALVAAGKQIPDKDKATEEDKKTSGRRNPKGRKLKMCEFCKTEHWGAGKGCLARKCNKHLRPDNWSGAEIDK